jgi:hypothetical protein
VAPFAGFALELGGRETPFAGVSERVIWLGCGVSFRGRLAGDGPGSPFATGPADAGRVSDAKLSILQSTGKEATTVMFVYQPLVLLPFPSDSFLGQGAEESATM